MERAIKFTKRNLLAILLGFLVVAGIGIITTFVSVFFFRSVFLQQPPTFIWLLKTVSYLSLLAGGFVVGWIVREKGWVYGGLLGMALVLVNTGLAILFLLLPISVVYGPDFPPDYGKGIAQKQINNAFLNAPKTILLTSLGGFLGAYLYKRKRRD